MADLKSQKHHPAHSNQVDTHILVAHPVTAESPDWDYDIEHPKSCPMEDFDGYKDYVCPEGCWIAAYGVDELLVDIEKPGRYGFELFQEEIPGTPYNSGFTEYDAYLVFTEQADTKGIDLRLDDHTDSTEHE